MNNDKLLKTVNEIKNSDIYENSENWEARGLNSSDQQVIDILRKVTNNFLDRLVKIDNSNETFETKLKQISNLVDELPWDELDTEEKSLWQTLWHLQLKRLDSTHGRYFKKPIPSYHFGTQLVCNKTQ